MAGDSRHAARLGVYPRCDMCLRVMRAAGVRGEGGLCSKCLAEALPFVGIERGGEFYRALKEYREGLDLGQAGQEGNRFNPFQGDDGGPSRG